MTNSALLSQMTSFSYFRWDTKDTAAGGCSVGYGYNPRTASWWKRVQYMLSSITYTLDDTPVELGGVPIEIMAAYLRKMAA